MNHRPLHITRLLLILFSALSLHASAGTLGSLTYEIVNGTSVTITNCSTTATGEITVPATIEGLPVTNIEEAAFRQRDEITSVILSENLIEISAAAFAYCDSLQQVSIPDSVTSIAEGAFSGCQSLQTVTVGEGNTSYIVHEGVLYNADLTLLHTYPSQLTEKADFIVPSTVQSIAIFCFNQTDTLTSLYLPASVSELSPYSLHECPNLANIHVDPSNTFFHSTDGVLFETTTSTLFRYPPAKSGNYSVPAGTETIGTHAFTFCKQLTEVSLPPSVKSIQYGGFRHCTQLSKVHFSEGLETIHHYAFLLCENITEMTLPSSVTSLTSGYNFIFCNNLRSFTFSQNISTIPKACFYGCNKLETVNIPEGITSIEEDIFYFGTPPTTLTLPSTLQHIGRMNDSDLKRIIFKGNAPTITTTPIAGAPYFHSSTRIYYYAGNTGFNSSPWNLYPRYAIDLSVYPAGTWLVENNIHHTAALDLDLNGDGVPLLMEYALGLKAYQNNAPNLPQMEIGETTAGITFQGDTPGINYEVWTSTDLSNWTQTGVTLSTPDANGKRTATIPHSASSRAFLQLRVSQ